METCDLIELFKKVKKPSLRLVSTRCAQIYADSTVEHSKLHVRSTKQLLDLRRVFPFAKPILIAPTFPSKDSGLDRIIITDPHREHELPENCVNITFRHCKRLEDAFIFSALTTLDIRGSMVSDVSCLADLQKLNISGCVNVHNVSSLFKLRSLDISHCPYISDISMLGGLNSLKAASCFRIENVSKLGSLKKLNISCCIRVTDVGELGAVKKLNISGCIAVTDVSELWAVEELDMGQLFKVTDVSKLGRLKSLDLSGCTGIRDVSMLTGLKRLSLYWCRVDDVSMLSGVKLDLDNCIVAKK